MHNQQDYTERDELRARFTGWLDATLYHAKLRYLEKEAKQIETVSLDGSVEREGRISVWNSVIYANGVKDYESRSKVNPSLGIHSQTGTMSRFDGDYVFLDWDAPRPILPPHFYPVLCTTAEFNGSITRPSPNRIPRKK